MVELAPVDANPLLGDWEGPLDLPPFAAIQPAHFRPAFDHALAQHRAEVEAIIADAAEPTFANTIDALERSGKELARISAVFFNLSGAHTNEAIEAVERDMAPVLSRHYSWMFLNEALYRRIAELNRIKDGLGLTAEQERVLSRYLTVFKRAGGSLPQEAKDRLAAISERLAALGTQFAQNVLADEKNYMLVLEGEEDLAGLPDFLRDAARAVAEERGLAGRHVITLARSSIESFLQFSSRRDLREKAFKAWIARGHEGDTDNRAIIAETIALRDEKARLLGYKNFAQFRLDDTMAGTPEAALRLLQDVWKSAREMALSEQQALQAMAQEEGSNEPIAAWDWRYFTEKRRTREFDLDESTIKPFFQLEKMIEAAFYTANRLFGLTFASREDLSVYHPDVRVWEVRDAEGRHRGLFLGDYFARPSKRSGAWMSSYRTQERLDGPVHPIIVNVMNFSKGKPALLSFDDAHTLFHEFGHALHGLLSDVTYPMISGTAVSRDFVEFPSQLYEHWLEQPEILSRFAVHHGTGEPMPADLLKRLLAGRTFNQGFATVEYTACALVDLDLHMAERPEAIDIDAFERATLARIGMPEAIVLRHRPTHFTHVFSGDGYSSAYYSYLWSEVLDADGFRAFKEAGDIFDPATADRLLRFVYAAGNSREPAEAYSRFRGRAPDPAALLVKRGLAAA
ncbi:dipeptidyl carboxypeptidase II [Agaricicola taiwanensis]|uniref:Dipeptidyl carboxypeptidase II n=1 Tax=Agaricicola taiwanensis TaxID=591372 RepID=A0A8J3DWS0_9RHOB|nr:M3 family metallopeptidase [Agaricicola taiwanensis]GGE47046.1 dipeptidyl carboxypeptidase II [Agaricicola taiwanensis]